MSKPRRQFALRAPIRLVDDVPLIEVPLSVRKALGRDENEIPVRVLMEGLWFVAMIRARYPDGPVFSFELEDPFNPPPEAYELYIYKGMRAALKLFVNRPMKLVFEYDPEGAKPSRRGRIIRELGGTKAKVEKTKSAKKAKKK